MYNYIHTYTIFYFFFLYMSKYTSRPAQPSPPTLGTQLLGSSNFFFYIQFILIFLFSKSCQQRMNTYYNKKKVEIYFLFRIMWIVCGFELKHFSLLICRFAQKIRFSFFKWKSLVEFYSKIPKLAFSFKQKYTDLRIRPLLAPLHIQYQNNRARARVIIKKVIQEDIGTNFINVVA